MSETEREMIISEIIANLRQLRAIIGSENATNGSAAGGIDDEKERGNSA